MPESTNSNYQSMQINILDADTNQIIQKDFEVLLYPFTESRIIKSGSDRILLPKLIYDFINFNIEDKQLKAYGYNYASDVYNPAIYQQAGKINPYFGNNVVYFQADKILSDEWGKVYICPTVVNIYLKKVN